MLNTVVKFFFNKEIVLYNNHRQVIPLLKNEWNKRHFIFFETILLWRLIPFSSKARIKFKIMFLLLNFVSPRFILDVNWISKWHSLYFLWCKNHSPSKFIVVQHGLYVGGIITDIAHRYSKCQVMLCWGAYFKDVFNEYNPGKKVYFSAFGNTVHNQVERRTFHYPVDFEKNILIAPSGIKGQRLIELIRLKEKLEHLGFSICLKEHNFQERSFQNIEGFKKVHGDIYCMLREKKYGLVISDHSSCLLDAVYFKNRVLFFGPADDENRSYNENVYSQFLPNLAVLYKDIVSMQELFSLVDLEAQEKLYDEMISLGDNSLEEFMMRQR